MSTDVWNTPERVALRKVARDFTVREIAPNVAQWERAGELPRSLHKKASEAGLLGVAFPESVGGQGGNSIDSTIVNEEILYNGGSGGVLASLFTHGIALPHIIGSGNTDLIDRYAKPTLAGRLIGPPAVTEPDAGHDHR